jgi:hypothetical protein
MALEPMARPCLTVLFQNADDLVFGEPAALHLWSFRFGQSLPQTGLGGEGNVSRSDPYQSTSLMLTKLLLNHERCMDAMAIAARLSATMDSHPQPRDRRSHGTISRRLLD